MWCANRRLHCRWARVRCWHPPRAGFTAVGLAFAAGTPHAPRRSPFRAMSKIAPGGMGMSVEELEKGPQSPIEPAPVDTDGGADATPDASSGSAAAGAKPEKEGDAPEELADLHSAKDGFNAEYEEEAVMEKMAEGVDEAVLDILNAPSIYTIMWGSAICESGRHDSCVSTATHTHTRKRFTPAHPTRP